MLDVSDRLIVIIGGGAVAARKAATLLETGATRVRVVAPQFDPQMSTRVERIHESYQARHLDGAQLVFAATDSPATNAQVVRDAHSRGMLVNRADEAEPLGDFITPARFQEGEVIVSVAAGSAALAVAIRNDLARRLDRRYAKMAHAMQTLRPLIRSSNLDPDKRGSVFRDLASDEALETIAVGGLDQLKRWIATRHPDLHL
jgi:precorrin-2 dehydrogenase/sirohydrochlorin ferrochelatase